MTTTLGRIRSIWRYPVKSMAGEQLPAADVTLQGLAGDRMYAFVQAGSSSPFPWLTGREMPSLLQYHPRWREAKPPRLDIRTPAGDELPIESDELRVEVAAASGRDVFLLPNYRGSFDVAPITLISDATIDRIAEASQTPPNPGRFRMNFYIDTGGEPFAEDAWVGRTLRLGDVRIAVTERDRRCAMVTLDPASSNASPAVLRATADLNDAYAGVYAVVLIPGQVREGQELVAE